MPYDFTTPPRAFTDPSEDKHLTRRSWVLGIRDALSDLCEKVANRDQAGGYPSLDSAARLPAARMPLVDSPIRAGTFATNYTPDAAAATGNLIDVTATADISILAPINGVNHQRLRLHILASGAVRTITFAQNGSTSFIYPMAHLPMVYPVASGQVLAVELEFSALAGGWLLTHADIEGVGDGGQFSCTNAGAAQSVGANANTPVAYGTNVATTGLVTKAANGVGHQFTLNRAGVWAISHSALWTNGTAGNKRCLLNVAGTTGLPTWMAAGSGTTTATSGTAGNGAASGSVTARFAAGTVLYVAGYSVAADSIVAGQASLVLTYVGP